MITLSSHEVHQSLITDLSMTVLILSRWFFVLLMAVSVLSSSFVCEDNLKMIIWKAHGVPQ